jgi:uncharacterized membrane protein
MRQSFDPALLFLLIMNFITIASIGFLKSLNKKEVSSSIYSGE